MHITTTNTLTSSYLWLQASWIILLLSREHYVTASPVLLSVESCFSTHQSFKVAFKLLWGGYWSLIYLEVTAPCKPPIACPCVAMERRLVTVRSLPPIESSGHVAMRVRASAVVRRAPNRAGEFRRCRRRVRRVGERILAPPPQNYRHVPPRRPQLCLSQRHRCCSLSCGSPPCPCCPEPVRSSCSVLGRGWSVKRGHYDACPRRVEVLREGRRLKGKQSTVFLLALRSST